MIATYTFYFAQPWWLAACALAVPMVWMGLRNLNSLWLPRRVAAVLMRAAVVCLLAMLLARPMLAEKSDQLTVLAVVDRSKSIPLVMDDKGPPPTSWPLWTLPRRPASPNCPAAT